MICVGTCRNELTTRDQKATEFFMMLGRSRATSSGWDNFRPTKAAVGWGGVGARLWLTDLLGRHKTRCGPWDMSVTDGLGYHETHDS